MKYSKETIASAIEYTLWHSEATQKEICDACELVISNKCAAICINSSNIKTAARVLRGTDVILSSTVGFPIGAMISKAKANEACEAIKAGAAEISMVINVGAMMERNLQFVFEDIRDVVKACEGIPVKVIAETVHFNDDDKISICELSLKAGASFIATSTGYFGETVMVSDVALMKRCVGDKMGVIAVGGIKTAQDVAAMYEAGACRIGTNAIAEIFKKTSK